MLCLSPERTACGDGGLACSCERARKRHVAGASEGATGTGSLRKASRDRTETGDDPRRSAGALQMEDTWDRGLHLIVTEGWTKWSWRPEDAPFLRKQCVAAWGGDRVSEVRLDGSARKNHASHESE